VKGWDDITRGRRLALGLCVTQWETEMLVPSLHWVSPQGSVEVRRIRREMSSFSAHCVKGKSTVGIVVS
jgi:hypothetical protein